MLHTDMEPEIVNPAPMQKDSRTPNVYSILIDHLAKQQFNGGPHPKSEMGSSWGRSDDRCAHEHKKHPTLPIQLFTIGFCFDQVHMAMTADETTPILQNRTENRSRGFRKLAIATALFGTYTSLHHNGGTRSDKSRCLPGQYRWFLRNRHLRGDRLTVPTSPGWILVAGRV